MTQSTSPGTIADSLLLTDPIRQAAAEDTATCNDTEIILWFGGHSISGVAVTEVIVGGMAETKIAVPF
jgi:hypothetical protein